MSSGQAHKSLLVQGATGSIGKSTLSVVREHASQFSIAGLAAHSNVSDLIGLAQEFRVPSVAIADASKGEELRAAARQLGFNKIYVGEAAASEQAADLEYDLLINAMMGSAGIEPTLISLQRGISVALANKETLVAAGPLVMDTAHQNNANVIPIDSEHSAIFQCLMGESYHSIRRIWLTTSGGPFLRRSIDSLANVSIQDALAHPTWKMGQKITVDSATLFNKGLEVIEAERLFGVSVEQIEVVVHRQSVVHSMVEFCDGSIKAQLSTPDMRLPILFALTCPERIASDIVQTEITSLNTLTFEEVPKDNFPCLHLAFQALQRGGTAPAALSAADEIVVQAFLNGTIKFTGIAEVLENVLDLWPDEPLKSLEDVLTADRQARTLATESVRRFSADYKGVSCC